MHILYINQYFKTPKEAGSTRSYWISQELIKRGTKVTMVCHANRFLGATQTKLISKNTIDNIEVISVLSSYSNDMNALRRILSFLRFMIIATFVVLRVKKVDLLYASSTPLTIAFPALLRKLLRKTPFVFEVRDLWPEAPIQLGFIKNKLLIKFLRWFEKVTYRNARHVIALSPGMQAGVIKYVPAEKTSMIPNMAKVDQFWDREKSTEVNQKFGFNQDTFKLVYFGTMGMANGIDFLIEVIKSTEEKSIQNIEFIFLGEGAKKKKLIQLAETLNNVKLTVLDRQPMAEVSKIVNNADVSICTFSDWPILKTNSPNKLFDSLSAGKPSIVNSDGWTKELVENYNCGFYVKNNDVVDFINKVLLLIEDPNLKIEMGKNARKLAEQKFDKSILCKQVADVLLKN